MPATHPTPETPRDKPHTLQLFFHIQGGIDTEGLLGSGDMLTFYAQLGGITPHATLSRCLSVLEKNGLSSRFRNHGDTLILANYLTRLKIAPSSYDLNSDSVALAHQSMASQGYAVLAITPQPDNAAPTIPWSEWVAAFADAEGFALAVLTENDGTTAPARTEGFPETTGLCLWLGDGFWSMAGEETKSRILAAEWLAATEQPDGTLFIAAAPSDPASTDDTEHQARLRQLLFQNVRQWNNQQAEKRKEDYERRKQRLLLSRDKQAHHQEQAAGEPDAGQASPDQADSGIPPCPPRDPDIVTQGFGYKDQWLAVRSDSTAEVAAALGLREPRWLLWDNGKEEAAKGGDHVMLTPAIDGWVIVTGEATHPGNEPLLAYLSGRFGEAQAFATHRVSEYHHWSRWRNSVRTRSFAIVMGDVEEQEGEPTGIEKELLLPVYENNAYIDVSEQELMRVAADWSVAPCNLGQRELSSSHLLIGRLLPPGGGKTNREN